MLSPWKHYPIGYPCYPWKTTQTRYLKKRLPDSALDINFIFPCMVKACNKSLGRNIGDGPEHVRQFGPGSECGLGDIFGYVKSD